MNLSKEQEAIIKDDSQHLLVSANAGCGKTTVMIHKIKYLIEHKTIKPERILMTSFSRVAANELYEKTSKIINQQIADKLFIGTLHSLCYKIVSENLVKLGLKSINIVPEAYLSTIVFNRNPQLFSSKKESVKITAMYRNYLLSGKYPASIGMQEFNAVDEAQKIMESENKILFDDLMIKTIYLLKTFKEIKDIWSNKFDYLICDEVQDTNPIQWVLINMLQVENTRSIVIGDPKQSLYGFRGCSYLYMENYKNEKNCKILSLSETFRFGQEFADLSNKIVDNLELNSIYKNPTITNINNTTIPSFHHIYSADQPQFVFEDIRLKLSEGYQYSDMHLVYRYNKESLPFAKKFIEENIPFETKSGDIFERAELKFVLKSYSIIKNFNISDCMELFSMYSNFVGDKTLTSIYNSSTEKSTVLSFLNSACEGKIDGVGFKKLQSLRELKDKLHILNSYIHGVDTRVSFREIASIMDMDNTKFMLKESEDNDNPSEDRWDFLNFFQGSFEKSSFSNPLEWFSDIQLNGHKINESNKNKVQLKTIHGCKGQSLKIVYLIANRIADPMFINNEEAIEQEKYCLYVATTRAEKYMSILISDPKKFRFNYIFNDEWKKKYITDEEDNTNEAGEFEISSKILKQLQDNYRAKKRTYKSVINDQCIAVAVTERAIQFQQGKDKLWLPISMLGYGDNRFFLEEWIIKKNKYEKYVEKY